MSANSGPKWHLKSEPDAYGFLYGEVVSERGETLRVDVMPPASEWRGQVRLEGFEPHATEWVAYLEGEKIAQAASKDELFAVTSAHLAKNVVWLDRERGRGGR